MGNVLLPMNGRRCFEYDMNVNVVLDAAGWLKLFHRFKDMQGTRTNLVRPLMRWRINTAGGGMQNRYMARDAEFRWPELPPDTYNVVWLGRTSFTGAARSTPRQVYDSNSFVGNKVKPNGLHPLVDWKAHRKGDFYRMSVRDHFRPIPFEWGPGVASYTVRFDALYAQVP